MRTLLFLWCLLPMLAHADTTKQYLVTKSQDTIYYKGDLIVDNEHIDQWKTIKADDREYLVRDIQSAYFNNTYYYNCDGRRLYQQVIKGNINVFALRASDTIPDKNGYLNKHVFIQGQNKSRPVLYTPTHLISMLGDNRDLINEMKAKSAKKAGGTAMVVSGAAVTGGTVIVGLFGALLSALFGDTESANAFLGVAAIGTTVGGGLMGGGFALKAGTKKVSLLPIHQVNTQ